MDPLDTLTTFIKLYDTDETGELDRTKWLALCSDEKINLPVEMAALLFDELDADADGHVSVTDLFKELASWQATQSLTPKVSSNKVGLSR
ncbi:unnamed protein product [Protopolystoma xenopodis]|uniref:EF-hand domain-containing protein n=1 Tax=Protopolystoma xenopodis TaxID=117903 RepID=A0A3S5FC69_9PLAT|nr:unnamed protein product [Protopolystoma xenopodis]